MNILVLCDDRWHPAVTVRSGLVPLEKHGFVFHFIQEVRAWSAEKMSQYPVVILSKSNHVSSSNYEPWMTEKVEAAFQQYVRAGNGLLVIHSGSAGYAETPILRKLMGGVFTHHPAQCEVTMEPCNGHLLCEASTRFTVFDEHYFMDIDNNTDADVFLTATSEYGRQPAGWTREEGAGRVCMLTPGHNLEVWLHPLYQHLMNNALRWCGNIE